MIFVVAGLIIIDPFVSPPHSNGDNNCSRIQATSLFPRDRRVMKNFVLYRRESEMTFNLGRAN